MSIAPTLPQGDETKADDPYAIMRVQIAECVRALAATARALDATCDNLTQMGFFDRPHSRATKRHLDDAKVRLGKLGAPIEKFDADKERG